MQIAETVAKGRVPSLGRRVSVGLAAGGVAIVLNTLALQAASLVSLETARGGLLRLVTQVVGLAPAQGEAVKIGFHLAVGLAMALFYALVLEPWLKGPPLAKGLTYALALWVVNAAVILPLTGEGFAGMAHLTAAGMAWFAACHTLFFVALALLFQAGLQPTRATVRT